MEYCKYCSREFERHTSRVYHENRCYFNPFKVEQWNKGLTKEKDSRVRAYAEGCKKTKATLEYKKTHPVWNKGLTKEKDSRVKINGDRCKATKSSEEWKNKNREKIYKKYEGKHFTQTMEYKQKRKMMYKEKYGVENPLQRTEIFEKAQKRRYIFHDYTLPSGKMIRVQGYEGYAISKLLEEGYEEKDIYISQKDMPIIWYEDNIGIKHRYFPDIYIKSINKIIEVKSFYTFNFNKKLIDLKHQATLLLGIDHEVWVVYPEQNFFIKVEDIYEVFPRRWMGGDS